MYVHTVNGDKNNSRRLQLEAGRHGMHTKFT